MLQQHESYRVQKLEQERDGQSVNGDNPSLPRWGNHLKNWTRLTELMDKLEIAGTYRFSPFYTSAKLCSDLVRDPHKKYSYTFNVNTEKHHKDTGNALCTSSHAETEVAPRKSPRLLTELKTISYATPTSCTEKEQPCILRFGSC